MGTLERTEFVHNFVMCTLFHKGGILILQYRIPVNTADERFTYIGYIVRNL